MAEENKDNFCSPKMLGCLYTVAIELANGINPRPDVDELVNLGWMEIGRHYNGEVDGPMRFDYMRTAMQRAYFNGPKGNNRNSGVFYAGKTVPRKELHDNIGGVDSGFSEFEAREDIKFYLDKLNPNQRTVIEEYYLKGKTCQEIA